VVAKVSSRSKAGVQSLAAIVRTGVSAIASLIVLPVIIRQLSKEDYSVLVLGTSIGAYVGLAESGAGSAVIRFCSGRSHKEGSRVLNSAAAFVIVTGLLLAVLIGAIALNTGLFFGETPSSSFFSVRVVVLWGCLASMGGLLASVLSAYLLAHDHGVRSATANIFATVICNSCVVLVALNAGTAAAVAAAVSIGPIFNSLLLAGFVGKLVGRDRTLRLASRDKNRQLIQHTWIAGYWAIVGLLISGLDLVICARFDQTKVGAYGIAIRISTLVIWLFGAALTPVAAMFARAHASHDADAVTTLILRLSRRANSSLFALAGAMFVAAPFVIRLVAGERYVESASLVFRWLIIGNLVRNSGAVLGNAMLATGEHRRALVPPAVEASVGLAASVLLGRIIGAEGIALGTTIGATASTVLYIVYVFPRFRAFSVSRKVYVSNVLVRPLLVFCPAIAAVFVEKNFQIDPYMTGFFGLGIIILIFFFFGLERTDRIAIQQGLKTLVRVYGLRS
jgi:O-antigen/teichoic acid export membrane protein